MKLALVSFILLSSSVLGAFITPKYPLRAASGYTARAVANGLAGARGIIFDTRGRLLVVQSGYGIAALTLASDGSLQNRSTVLAYSYLNHGIALSADGRYLYASSTNTVWRWNYDPATARVSGQLKMVTGLGGDDHRTRTLFLSKRYPNLLLVSRGSNGNVDLASYSPTAGPATIAAFDVSSIPKDNVGVDWSKGRLVAWGVRNEVGLTEDLAGRLWGVENSADNLVRTVSGRTTDVHQDNPGEKLHLFGDVKVAASPSGNKFYGYPYCFSVWTPASFPAPDKFKVGDWFTQVPSSTFNDTTCNTKAIKPALLFQAHSAPLDVKFGPTDTSAYVSFHGSWNRQPPTGYKVVRVDGRVGVSGWEPNAPLTSNSGYVDILSNVDVAKCPSACFRPVGLAWAPGGRRLYVSSDATGEILLLSKN